VNGVTIAKRLTDAAVIAFIMILLKNNVDCDKLYSIKKEGVSND
jgi:hypothetical protein